MSDISTIVQNIMTIIFSVGIAVVVLSGERAWIRRNCTRCGRRRWSRDCSEVFTTEHSYYVECKYCKENGGRA